MTITNSVQNNYSLADNYKHDNGYVQQIRHNQDWRSNVLKWTKI